MAPPSSDQPSDAVEAAGAGAISKVLVVIGAHPPQIPFRRRRGCCFALLTSLLLDRLLAAMQTEALPLVTKFQLVEAATDESMSVFHPPFGLHSKTCRCTNLVLRIF
jgi:hypothetical protein